VHCLLVIKNIILVVEIVMTSSFYWGGAGQRWWDELSFVKLFFFPLFYISFPQKKKKC